MPDRSTGAVGIDDVDEPFGVDDALRVLLAAIAAQIAGSDEPVAGLDDSAHRPGAAFVVRHSDDDPHPLIRPDHLTGFGGDLVLVRDEREHARGQ